MSLFSTATSLGNSGIPTFAGATGDVFDDEIEIDLIAGVSNVGSLAMFDLSSLSFNAQVLNVGNLGIQSVTAIAFSQSMTALCGFTYSEGVSISSSFGVSAGAPLITFSDSIPLGLGLSVTEANLMSLAAGTVINTAIGVQATNIITMSEWAEVDMNFYAATNGNVDFTSPATMGLMSGIANLGSLGIPASITLHDIGFTFVAGGGQDFDDDIEIALETTLTGSAIVNIEKGISLGISANITINANGNITTAKIIDAYAAYPQIEFIGWN